MKRNVLAVTIVMLVIPGYKQTPEKYRKIKTKDAHLENKTKGWCKVAKVKTEVKHM